MQKNSTQDPLQEVHSEPTLTENQHQAMHNSPPQIPEFHSTEAELAFYKQKYYEQQEQIAALQKLPHVQERLFEERLAVRE